MSHSPATPDKAGTHANKSEFKAPQPSSDKLTSTSKVKQTSLNEPSPASTYGDTIAGGSSPATPLDVGSHGKCMTVVYYCPARHSPRFAFCVASLLRVLLELDEYILLLEARTITFRPQPLLMAQLMGEDHHVAGLIHSLHAAQIDPAIETISGSPMAARDGKYPHRNVSTTSSPSTDRVKAIRESPSWRNKGGNFPRRFDNHEEDPFVSSANAGQSQGQGKSSLSQMDSALTVQGNNTSFSPRRDRTGVPLSNDNAQAMLPPRACVFVAK